MPKKEICGSHRRWWIERRNKIANAKSVARATRRKHQVQAQVVRKPTAVIPMPTHLIVERDDQRAALRRTLSSAQTLLAQGSKVRLDFSRVEKIFPGGMLVFVAHLYLMQLMHPGMVSLRTPPGGLAAQLVEHFGINRLLGGVEGLITPTHESVVNWRYLTGTSSDGEKISELLNSYRDQTDAVIPEGLYDVLAEAFTNVRHHAFRGDEFEFEELKRWWLFARYVAPSGDKPGNLYIAIYDIGIGIQASMRRQLSTGELVLDAADELLQLVGAGQSRMLERMLLQRAVDHERSSTGLKNRGLGLPEMKEFVLSTKGGRLYILSGQAQYSCLEAVGKGHVFDCQNGFAGTLILWSLPLVAKEST